MKRDRITYIKNIVFPCLLFSVISGVFTASLIFVFRQMAAAVGGFSESLYDFVRQSPQWFPLLFLGAILAGVLSWLFLKYIPDCRGGGIPTAIAQLRGLIPFRWLSSILGVFASSMLTFLCGIPLGSEGPGVQIGAAVGRGTVRLLGRKNPSWDRYIMTGGACAGFAAVTGAPISGILFGMEEAHRRFSPMLFMVSSVSVLSGAAAMELFCNLSRTHWEMFPFLSYPELPLNYLWTALIVGLVCGLFSVVFSKLYRMVLENIKKLEKFPFFLRVISVFAIVAVCGFFFRDSVGSGHTIVESLLENQGGGWIALFALLILRALLLIFANNVGITGGLFVPSLAIGAILGFLCGKGFIVLEFVPEEYLGVFVIVGMASFLGSSSHIPLTATVFAVEALSGLQNILPIALGVAIAYFILEIAGDESFTETVIEGKVEAVHAGKTPHTVDTALVVRHGSFVVGKEIRDILWPPNFTVTTHFRDPAVRHRYGGCMEEGDVLYVHYKTYDDEATVRDLEHLVGVRGEVPLPKDSDGGDVPQF